MSDKCSIKPGLVLIFFVFYLSVEALESNDVTDYDGRKTANRDGSWKETKDDKEASPEWGTSISSSSFEGLSQPPRIKDTISPGEFLISSIGFSRESIISPTPSGNIMPLGLSSAAFTERSNTRVISDITTARISTPNSIATSTLTQKGVMSDVTQRRTIAISDMSYTTVASGVRLPTRTRSLQIVSGVTPSRRSITETLVLSIGDKVSSLNTRTPSSFSVMPGASFSSERSNISSTKTTTRATHQSVGANAIVSLDSYSSMKSHLIPTTSLVFSRSTKSTLGLIPTDNASIASLLLNPTSSASFHKQLATGSPEIDQRTINSSNKASFVSIVSPSIFLTAKSVVGMIYSKSAKATSTVTTRIFSNSPTSNLPFYSKSRHLVPNAGASFTTRSENHRSLVSTFRQHLNESSAAALEGKRRINSTAGFRAGTVMPTISNVGAIRFRSTSSKTQSFFAYSEMNTVTLGEQQMTLSQAKNFVLSTAITGRTKSIGKNSIHAAEPVSSRLDIRNVTNTTYLSIPKILHPRTVTPKPSLHVFNTVIMNSSSLLAMKTTEAGIERHSTDVTATLSYVIPEISFTRSSTEFKRRQSQESNSIHASLQASKIILTSISKKHFLTASGNPSTSLSQPMTPFVSLNSTIASLHSTRYTAAKSSTLREETSSRLRMSLIVPTMDFTVHLNSTRWQFSAYSAEAISSTYSNKSFHSSASTIVSSAMTTQVAPSVVSLNSTSLLTPIRASKAKSILTAPTSWLISPMAPTKTASIATSLEPVTPKGTTRKEKPVTEPRTTSQRPLYIGEPTVHTKLLAKYPFALNVEFHVSFPGIAEAYKLQIVAQKYDRRSISENGKRLRTWYEVHYFEDYKHEPYIVVEFTKRHSVRRSNFNFTIGSDTQCEAEQVRFRYCNGPLHKGAYRFRLLYHVHGKIKRSAFSKVYTTAAVASTPQDETSGLNQSKITVAVIVVLAVLLVIIIIIAIILYKRKNSNQNDNFGDTEMSDCTLLTSLRRTSSCSKGCYGRGAMGTADSSVMLKSLTKAMSRPVHVKDFIAWVTRSQADSDFRFAEEFESIRDVGRDQSHEASDVPENRGKNRYVNVLAYDRTRVKLSYTDDEIGSDYINANYIHGYNHPRAYIATQGPLPGTTDDFWRMIWEQNTFVVVMATQCVEVNRVKCHQYWPGVQPTAFGEIVVSLLSENSYPEWIERELLLEVENEGSRRVHHFQYVAWPDHGVPKNAATALEFIHTVRSHVIPGQGPIVVHCSAGVGRTGTLIAIDTILNRLQEEDTIDVYLCVCFMRMQRCSMVQTEEQYIFIHRVLVEYLKSRNTASLLKGYSLLPKEENDDDDVESEGCPSTNRDSGLALLLGEYGTEHVEEALESIA